MRAVSTTTSLVSVAFLGKKRRQFNTHHVRNHVDGKATVKLAPRLRYAGADRRSLIKGERLELQAGLISKVPERENCDET